MKYATPGVFPLPMRTLSSLQPVGWAKALLGAVPTIFQSQLVRAQWWARRRTRSRPAALPTLRGNGREPTSARRQSGLPHDEALDRRDDDHQQRHDQDIAGYRGLQPAHDEI